MQVNVISKTIQEFNGIRYYKCGPYYQRKGARLHRAVWEYHNGKIPPDSEVHHKNHDRTSNDIGNLELQTIIDHHSYHRRRNGVSDRAVALMHEGARKWHGSESGKKWHKKQYRKYSRDAFKSAYIKIICSECGTEFTGPKYSKFCSLLCGQRAWLRGGKGLQERNCVYCGQIYKTVRTSNRKFCSRACSAKYRWERSKGPESIPFRKV